MKIAMIGQKRIPSREGGVEIHVEEIAVRLVKMGNDVTVYNRRKRGFPLLHEYKGVRIVNVPTINRKSLDAVVYSFLATIHALSGHYDVIHYHAEGPCSMLWIPHLFGIRTVATIHGLDWQRAKWGGFATKFLLFGEKTAAKYANEVIVLSQNMRRYFKDTYHRDTRVIPNGINAPVRREPNIIRSKYGLTKGNYVLFLARIVPEKGLHYLLRAFSGIETDKKLVVAGSGSHTDAYYGKMLQLAQNDQRVLFTGFVQGAELDELYSNAFLYVLPSDVEGMPISLLEAMSYGCPCLVSDIRENLEIGGKLVYKFSKGQVNSLQKQLTSILNQNVVDRKIDSSATILSRYQWSKTADDIFTKAYGKGR